MRLWLALSAGILLAVAIPWTARGDEQEFPHGDGCTPIQNALVHIGARNPIRYAVRAHKEEGARAISWFKLQNNFTDAFDYDLVVVIFHQFGPVTLLFGFVGTATTSDDTGCFVARIPDVAMKDLMRAIEGDRA